MDRGILVGNRLCAKRLEEAKHARHVEKLNKIRAGIDNKLPVSASFTHLRSNPKREQLMEDTYTEIDRANKVLLQRMSEIIKQPSEMSCISTKKKFNRSLNHESRKKELQRITNENLAILKRIQDIQPAYDHVSWEHDYRRTREYMKNSCELPVVLGSSPSALVQIPSTGANPTEPATHALVDIDRLYSEEGIGTAVGDRPQFRYLAKDGRRIGHKFYLIEVSTDGSGLLVSAFSGEEADGDLELYLSKQDSTVILQKLNGDYTKLIEKVRVGNGRISLLPYCFFFAFFPLSLSS
jgi:hypothetical protein